jgi:hypothetical protein
MGMSQAVNVVTIQKMKSRKNELMAMSQSVDVLNIQKIKGNSMLACHKL